MIIASILLAVGLGLIYLEFYLPGGIMGALGGLTCVFSIVLAVKSSSSLAGMAIFIVVSFVLLISVIKFALWSIRSSKNKDGIYNVDDQEGYRSEKFEESFVGKEGKAVSDLHPAGFILIEGKRLQAVSQVGYIKKGSKIFVVSGSGAHFVVKQIKSREEK